MASTINASTVSGIVQSADTSGVLALQTGGTTAVTVDASQNVGIGTTSPVTYARQTLAGGNLWVSAGTTNQQSNWSSFNYGIAFPDASGNPANGPGALITATGVSAYGASLQFAVRAGGGGNAVEAMRIDSSGRVTMPYQPAFYAYAQTGTSVGNVVIFDSALTNVGAHYSTSTGRFTAPIAGVYVFMVNVLRTNGAVVGYTIRKNGNTVAESEDTASSNQYSSVSQHCIIPLAANDYVDVRIGNGVAYGGGPYTTFAGYLLG